MPTAQKNQQYERRQPKQNQQYEYQQDQLSNQQYKLYLAALKRQQRKWK